MPRSGTADLPLHGGSAPRWLFERMEDLSREISEVIIQEYGREELLDRLCDPYWFQGFGCVLGFDWHSSGLTTTTMGALKEALDIEEHGVTVAGGKGATSRKTPEEVEEVSALTSSSREELKKASRLSAGVDSSAVQDSYTLYHHTLVFTEEGDWSVVQQGMNDSYARRYHWRSDEMESFVEEPQTAIASQRREQRTLNTVADVAEETRQVSVDLVKDDPAHLKRYVNGQSSLRDFSRLEMPRHHRLSKHDLTERSIEQLGKAYEVQPHDYEELLAVEGVGRKSLRALALISELVHGTENSWKDPAKYAYAHGGKDGTPFPVDREMYDDSVRHLQEALGKAEVDGKEKKKAFRRLHEYIE